MNEGKPTKANWWSRPRAHGAGAGTTGDHTGPTGSAGPTGTTGVPADAVREGDLEGDFELERPATARAPGGADTETETDSDFELARPAAEAPLRSGPVSPLDTYGDTDGDFELERPAATHAGRDAAPEASSVGEPGVTGSAGVAATAVAATAVARPLGQPGALRAPGAPSERPKPLHDPDPYSTPPYGEPGPWAPAPPVQHPATTPAHGTNVQAGTPAHGVPAAVGAPTHDGSASVGASTDSGAASAAAPTHAGAPSATAPTHAGTPSATAPTHTDVTSAAPPPSLLPPAHGTAVPPTTPQPTAAALHPDAPRPGAAPYPEAAQPAAASYAEAPQPAVNPFPEAPQPAAAPYPDASQPPGASYAYPSQPGPPPFGDSAQAVPPPYAGGARLAPPPHAGGSQTAPAAYADPAQPLQAAPQGPWQNYDPWAGSGSLQQNGAAVDDPARRRRRRVRVLLVGALLIAVVAGGIGGAVGAYLERNGGVGAVELPQASDGVTGRAPDSVAGIAASALPSVVTLHVSGTSAQGTGTGFVLDERGHILTNNHVVDPAGTNGDISVTFSGGETAKATIVGRDTGYDLAVVKVSGVGGLKPLPLGNSEEVQVGDPVVAIGAPFDLANTVTSGIISAKERPITAGGESGDVSDVSYVDALQTDAPINPGNSGGPLLDGKARVIGINSAIRSAGSGSESDGGQAGSIGLGFAIPINQGKRVAEELINTGKATHPVIGVTLDTDYAGDGARIGDDGGSGVTSGGPADRAGIRSGDVITEVDGQRVHSGDELIVKVRAHRPGDRLELTLLRNGREQTVTLTLGSSGGD
ncbi:trypsin-like peptidase domain-containing protein [Streptomyces sp. NPDC057474]|uniref:S1C family serine protease n=1 Tax=Streptomyces sp. NPDC057474 TaxID=3346144 RepID=UPI0036B02674